MADSVGIARIIGYEKIWGIIIRYENKTGENGGEKVGAGDGRNIFYSVGGGFWHSMARLMLYRVL